MRLSSPSPPLLCPSCSSDFLEEISPNSAHPAALLLSPPRQTRAQGFRRRFQRRRSPDPRPVLQILEITSLLSSLPASRGSEPSDGVAPPRDAPHGGFNVLDRLQSLFSRGDGAVQDPGGSDGDGLGSRRFVDVRDFFLGPGLDILIQQLAQGDGGRYGTAPALKTAIEAMPVLTISKQSVEADEVYCAVCKEIFEIGGEVREMPCKHIYHSDCILPWLALHSSCPICRHEMPAEESSDTQPRTAEENSPGIRQREEATESPGQRGLAIFEIPGVGIHVRSFILFGVGSTDEATPENQNVEAESGSSAPMSADSNREDAAPSTSGNEEEFVAPETEASNLRRPTRFFSTSRQGSSGNETVSGGGRSSFFSWLFRNSNSPQASTSAGQQANVDDGTNHVNSTRREDNSRGKGHTNPG